MFCPKANIVSHANTYLKYERFINLVTSRLKFMLVSVVTLRNRFKVYMVQGLTRQIITGDETYIHYYTPTSKQQSMAWWEPGEPALRKAKMIPYTGKLMVIISCKSQHHSGHLWADTESITVGQWANGPESWGPMGTHLTKKKHYAPLFAASARRYATRTLFFCMIILGHKWRRMKDQLLYFGWEILDTLLSLGNWHWVISFSFLC